MCVCVFLQVLNKMNKFRETLVMKPDWNRKMQNLCLLKDLEVYKKMRDGLAFLSKCSSKTTLSSVVLSSSILVSGHAPLDLSGPMEVIGDGHTITWCGGMRHVPGKGTERLESFCRTASSLVMHKVKLDIVSKMDARYVGKKPCMSPFCFAHLLFFTLEQGFLVDCSSTRISGPLLGHAGPKTFGIYLPFCAGRWKA